MTALPRNHGRQRVFLLLRMFVALGNIKALVEMANALDFRQYGGLAPWRNRALAR
jgi:hypothetical protein